MKSEIGIYIGRFNPIHLGHQRTLNYMLDNSKDNLLFIGSSNHPMTLRHFFDFKERHDFVRTIYPNLKILELSDKQSDADWWVSVESALNSVFGKGLKEVTFFGGSESDIDYIRQCGYNYKIVDRYESVTFEKNLSSTQVRDYLIRGHSLEGLIDSRIASTVSSLFAEKWKKFERI